MERFTTKQVLHGDIKPSNIFIPQGGDVAQAKLSDLGLSEFIDNRGYTGEGTLLGTPLYMPPEAFLTKARTVASDFWSLGVVLYQCAYGMFPFGRRSDRLTALVSSVFDDEPLFAPLPGHVDRVLKRALRKRPEERFGSAAEFAAALSQCRIEIARRSRALELSTAAVRSAVAYARRHPWRLVGGLTLAGIAAGLLVSTWSDSWKPTSAFRVTIPFALGIGVALLLRAVIGFRERRHSSSQQRLQGAAEEIRQKYETDVSAHTIAVAVESLLMRTSGDPSIDLRRASLAFAIDDFRKAKDRGEQRSALDRATEIADKLQEQIKASAPPWYVRKKEAIAVIVAIVGAATAFLSKVVELRK